jgi:methylated-DNA-[protein]-cysteine S-methyltransferase
MDLIYKHIESPVGRLQLGASSRGIVRLMWGASKLLTKAEAAPHAPLLLLAERQLGEYFACRRQRFDLPLDLRGTEFQRRVWQALLRIPYGETRSYKQLAESLGSPQACRAVGLANGRNPIGIIVPCHRVIGANGSLTGFAGGLERKRLLLDLENRRTAPQLQLF